MTARQSPFFLFCRWNMGNGNAEVQPSVGISSKDAIMGKCKTCCPTQTMQDYSNPLLRLVQLFPYALHIIEWACHCDMLLWHPEYPGGAACSCQIDHNPSALLPFRDKLLRGWSDGFQWARTPKKIEKGPSHRRYETTQANYVRHDDMLMFLPAIELPKPMQHLFLLLQLFHTRSPILWVTTTCGALLSC